jgi:hypothetical protein
MTDTKSVRGTPWRAGELALLCREISTAGSTSVCLARRVQDDSFCQSDLPKPDLCHYEAEKIDADHVHFPQ